MKIPQREEGTRSLKMALARHQGLRAKGVWQKLMTGLWWKAGLSPEAKFVEHASNRSSQQSTEELKWRCFRKCSPLHSESSGTARCACHGPLALPSSKSSLLGKEQRTPLCCGSIFWVCLGANPSEGPRIPKGLGHSYKLFFRGSWPLP